MKVVINTCFGGFRLSSEAAEWLIENRGWGESDDEDFYYSNPEGKWVFKFKQGNILKIGKLYSDDEEFRSDEDVVAAVEALGKGSSARVSKLKVVEIPDNIIWEITEYDGVEAIREVSRTWS